MAEHYSTNEAFMKRILPILFLWCSHIPIAHAIEFDNWITSVRPTDTVLIMPGDFDPLTTEHIDMLTTAVRDHGALGAVIWPIPWGLARKDVSMIDERVHALSRIGNDTQTLVYPTLQNYRESLHIPQRVLVTGAHVIGITAPEYKDSIWRRPVEHSYARYTHQWVTMEKRPNRRRRSYLFRRERDR